MSDSVLLAAVRLVERGTWTLSDSDDPKQVFQTEAFDISVRGGRIYSGVAPGGSVVAAPVYFVVRRLLRRFDVDVVASRRLLSYYLANARVLGVSVPHLTTVYLLQILLVLVVIAPLYALFLSRLEHRLRLGGADGWQAGLVVLTLGLGTMTLFYSAMYSRQALAYLLAWHAMLSFWSERPPSGAKCALAGLLLGGAVSVDYPAAVLVGLFVLAVLRGLSWRHRLWLVAPLAAIAALVALYHQSAFGSPFATPYHYRYWYTAPTLAERGIDLARFQQGGSLGSNLPSPSVMLQLCIGTFKGLFVYSPILALGLAGNLLGLRRESRRRSAHVFALVVFLVYLVLNSTLGTHVPGYGRYFWGGLSVLWGPRYLFAVLPFLALGLIRFDGGSRAARWVLSGLLALSVVFNVLGTMFSHVLMSTFAFSPELDFPVRYVVELAMRLGPREPLLDSYGASPVLQSAILVVLLGLSFLLWRSGRPHRQEGAPDPATPVVLGGVAKV